MASQLVTDTSFEQIASNTSDVSSTLTWKDKEWRSEVWTFCRPPNLSENQTYLYCAQCPQDPSDDNYKKAPYGENRPGNMKIHLEKFHKIYIKIENKAQEKAIRQLNQLHLQAKASGLANDFEKGIIKGSINHEVLIQALITMIVVRNLSFTIVEWPEFHAFTKALNPETKGLLPTSHNTIRRYIQKAFLRHKDTVRRLLQSAASSIHIALDIWTSPNRWLLLGIVAHFTSVDLKPQRALLALKKVSGHSGLEQFSVLLPVLEDYGIVRKLGAIIGDNAKTNDTLCKAIEEYWEEKLDMTWKVEDWRIRCMGHIINLIVHAFLFAKAITMEELESYDEEDINLDISNDEIRRVKFRLLGPLGKAHNINAHMRKSPMRTEFFRKMANKLIPIDNHTR
jgi:hypothetical protein